MSAGLMDGPQEEQVLRGVRMITSIVDRLDQGFTESEKVRKFLKRTIDGFMEDHNLPDLIAPGWFYDPFFSTGGRDNGSVIYSLLIYLWIILSFWKHDRKRGTFSCATGYRQRWFHHEDQLSS